MGKHVLAVTDGSAAAQAALAWAAAVCTATRSDLTVATAWQPEHPDLDPAVDAEGLELARRRLEDDWCAILRTTGVDHDAVVLEGDPRQVIPAWSVEHGVDLVAMGGRGPGDDHRLGAVATFLAHNLRRPLVAVPFGATGVPEHIVVGVDGSAGSSSAIEWCASFAPDLHASVLAVFAEVPVAEWVPRTDPKSWYRRARHSLEQWTEPLQESSVHVERRIVEHEVGRALLELANDGTTDLLVLGTRGRGGFAELLLGSTALKMLHRSDVPVVLVPTRTDHQE